MQAKNAKADAEMMNTMFVTGYSYKGGVGRSTALANIASLLAQDTAHPQRVLLWDFDLEAPGVHRLFPSKQKWRRGFVDLAYEYAATGTLEDPTEFAYQSVVPGIDVLPAGIVDEGYCDKLARIDWPSFFGDDPKERGPFFDWLVGWCREARYDYVLIDSRTGLSDVAGICTQVLPDVLLVFFRLTEQNIDGVSHLTPAIRDQLRLRGRTDIPILPVVSPVLPQSSGRIDILLKQAKDVFNGNRLHYIRFDADLVAEERLFCLEEVKSQLWPEPPIVGDYERLSGIIRDLNSYDTRTLFKAFRRSIHESDYASARNIIPGLLRRRPNDPDLWRHLRLVCRATPKGLEFGDELVNELEESGEQNVFVLDWQASHLAEKATSPSSNALKEASICLRRSIEISPERHSAYRRLAEIAECTGDLDLGIESLERLHALKSDNMQSTLDLANFYVRRGRDYFMLAMKLLEPHKDVVQTPILVYLHSFFGDEFNAGIALEQLKSANSSITREQYSRVIEAHSHLLLGKSDVARIIAEETLTEASGDVGNWAELYICLGDYEKSIALLEEARNEAPDEDLKLAMQRYDGLVRLAEYLNPMNDSVDADKVFDEWQMSWNFTELIFHRERVLSDESCRVPERWKVIEQLIRRSALSNVRGDESVFWRRGTGRPHVLIQHFGHELRARITSES